MSQILETITIKQQSLPPQEMLIKDRGQRIDFYPTHFIIFSSGDWKNPNEDTGILEEFFCDNTILIEKHHPVKMEMYYYNKCKKYILIIDDCKIIFGEDGAHPLAARKQCQELMDKIIKWKYS